MTIRSKSTPRHHHPPRSARSAIHAASHFSMPATSAGPSGLDRFGAAPSCFFQRSALTSSATFFCLGLLLLALRRQIQVKDWPGAVRRGAAHDVVAEGFARLRGGVAVDRAAALGLRFSRHETQSSWLLAVEGRAFAPNVRSGRPPRSRAAWPSLQTRSLAARAWLLRCRPNGSRFGRLYRGE